MSSKQSHPWLSLGACEANHAIEVFNWCRRAAEARRAIFMHETVVAGGAMNMLLALPAETANANTIVIV